MVYLVDILESFYYKESEASKVHLFEVKIFHNKRGEVVTRNLEEQGILVNLIGREEQDQQLLLVGVELKGERIRMLSR